MERVEAAGGRGVTVWRITKKIVTGYRIPILFTLAAVGLGLWFMEPIGHLYSLLADREAVKTYISAWGHAAPGVFILLQILQVVLAPVPGEISGFIGGYLFGALQGFVLSSLGLTIGSVINFGIGRLLNERVVRRIIPDAHLERLDRFVKRQGVLWGLIFFVIPGFPKDYLSLFLGFSSMPFRVFFVIAAIGRMPGTLMLSLQGACLYDRNYGMLAFILGMSALLVAIAYFYRNRLYAWAQQGNSR